MGVLNRSDALAEDVDWIASYRKDRHLSAALQKALVAVHAVSLTCPRRNVVVEVFCKSWVVRLAHNANEQRCDTIRLAPPVE